MRHFVFHQEKAMMNFDEMMKMDVQRLYDMEKELMDGLLYMSENATNPQLKQAFDQHRSETMVQCQRLEQIAQMRGFEPDGEKSYVARALIKETKDTVGDMDPSPLKDAALIACAQKVEHVEMAAYGTARTFAMQAGLQDAVGLFEQTLQEEKNADQTLTQLAESGINQEALKSSGQAYAG